MTHKITYIVIHESDTPNGRQQTVADIDSWHSERGFRRSDSARKAFNPQLRSIGYHYVIYIDGSLHTGRAESEIPAAVQGFNSVSINICMIGKGKYTAAQWQALSDLVAKLKGKYPAASVKGHYQLDTKGKTCPDFDVPLWVASGMQAAAKNVLEVSA